MSGGVHIGAVMESASSLSLPSPLERNLFERLWLVGSLIALACGLALIYWGSQKLQAGSIFDISVAQDDGSKRIINSGLSNDRLVMMMSGMTITICGIILSGASVVVLAIDRLCRQSRGSHTSV